MELQQLRYFASVARLRNFTRAAEECSVSQPALSIQIKKLESELGGPLFHRQGRTIALTNLGEQLEARAEALLLMHQSTLDELKDAATTGGQARFGATLTIAPYLIPFIVGHSSSDELPAFRMQENFTEGLLSGILDGTLDFALMSTPVEVPKLLVKIVAWEPFVLVMPKNHRLAKRGKVIPAKIKDEPFLPLSQIHCAGRQINEFYQQFTARSEAAFESAQIETILKLVREGQGITLLPKMAVLGSLDDSLCFRPIEGAKIGREISMVHHPDRYLSTAARKLMALIEVGIAEFVS